ncbi:hypothetical protein [Nostoc sp.]
MNAFPYGVWEREKSHQTGFLGLVHHVWERGKSHQTGFLGLVHHHRSP